MSNAGELLTMAVEAHGGPEQWRSVQHIVILARSGGIALPLRFKPSAFYPRRSSNRPLHKITLVSIDIDDVTIVR
jgi:hypothetical protein